MLPLQQVREVCDSVIEYIKATFRFKEKNERNIPSKATEGYPFNGMDVLEKKEFLSGRRSLLYVAVTRVRGLVYMVGLGEPCHLVEYLAKNFAVP